MSRLSHIKALTMAAAVAVLAGSGANADPVQFDITAGSFTPGTGYGGPENETASPTLLDVRFDTSGFSPQSFLLTNMAPSPGSTMTFLFGTIDFQEPNDGNGIQPEETDNLGVEANFTFVNPQGILETVTATGTALTGPVVDLGINDIDFMLEWNPTVVNFGNGGSFRIDLNNLKFTRRGVMEQMATITLLAMPENPVGGSSGGSGGGDVSLPEPGTLALFGLGLAGLGFMRRHVV